MSIKRKITQYLLLKLFLASNNFGMEIATEQ